MTRALAHPLLLASVLLTITVAGCASATPSQSTDAGGGSSSPSTAPSTAPATDPALCDMFNDDNEASGYGRNWVPATPDALTEWGITGLPVTDACQDLAVAGSGLVYWYGDDQTVCDSVTSTVTDELAAGGYTTSDLSSGDVIYLQSLSADGKSQVTINCYNPITASDLSDGDLSITPNSYVEGKSLIWLAGSHPES